MTSNRVTVDRLRFDAVFALRYRIESEIARGSTATVFLAEDVRHGRRVAVKVLSRDMAASTSAERFAREIEIAARLTHPHIVPLFDSGTVDGQRYYVMPYLAGETLRTRLQRESTLPIDVALRIAGDVAAALEHAHGHDVVHRDIKPENILLHGDSALVADFGIAKAVGDVRATGITAAGTTLGTPAYMSPEQVAADTELDARSDLYSLGVVLFEMLAGTPPFTGHSAQAVLAKRMSTPAPLVSNLRRGVPAHVTLALARTLERDPAQRFQAAAELSAALAHPEASALPRITPRDASTPTGGPVETRQPPVRVPPPRRTTWAIALLAALVVAAMIVALALRAHG